VSQGFKLHSNAPRSLYETLDYITFKTSDKNYFREEKCVCVGEK